MKNNYIYIGASWSYGSWINNYLCNQCLSPLKPWTIIPLMARCTWYNLCDEVCQYLATGWWFSPGTLVSSTSNTDRHYITEIWLKVPLNIITITLLEYILSLKELFSIFKITDTQFTINCSFFIVDVDKFVLILILSS